MGWTAGIKFTPGLLLLLLLPQRDCPRVAREFGMKLRGSVVGDGLGRGRDAGAHGRCRLPLSIYRGLSSSRWLSPVRKGRAEKGENLENKKRRRKGGGGRGGKGC